jgi:hypothetical protein
MRSWWSTNKVHPLPDSPHSPRHISRITPHHPRLSDPATYPQKHTTCTHQRPSPATPPFMLSPLIESSRSTPSPPTALHTIAAPTPAATGSIAAYLEPALVPGTRFPTPMPTPPNRAHERKKAMLRAFKRQLEGAVCYPPGAPRVVADPLHLHGFEYTRPTTSINGAFRYTSPSFGSAVLDFRRRSFGIGGCSAVGG